MAHFDYKRYSIETKAGGRLGFNVYIKNPAGRSVETLHGSVELDVVEAARAFVDHDIEENPLTRLQASGDTNDMDIDEDPNTVWTYASVQPVYQGLSAVTELFVWATDPAQAGTLKFNGTKSPDAAIPHEEVCFNRTLVGQNPVSLAVTEGDPTVEDLYDLLDMGPVTSSDVVTAGEIFVTGPGSSGGIPVGNVYGHLAVSDGVTRNETSMAVATVPAGFEAQIASFTVGAFEDAVVWLEVDAEGIKFTSFRYPVKAATERTFSLPQISGSVEEPARYPAGTRIQLMAKAKKAGGANRTRVGGELSLVLFKISAGLPEGLF